MQKVQCNAWIHLWQRITLGREIYENFISILQCTCKWCNAMHDFTSTHKSQGRKRGLQPHCFISMCVVVPVLTAPNLTMVSSYAYSIWECNSMIAMHELHIPPKFITPRAMPQVDKHINPQIKQNLDLIWLVWSSGI